MEHEDVRASQNPVTEADAAAVFQRLGAMTRQLHDALSELGVMPQLQQAAEGLPDARSRLNYVAEKTAAAAGKVLDAVDEAKALNAAVSAQARELAQRLDGATAAPPSPQELVRVLRDIEQRAEQADARLTDIMLAQDFHDLTGQVVARVVTLANELEVSLVKLLVEVAPEQAAAAAPRRLDGPVVDPKGRSDVAVDQAQVDDLLASLGF
jgi:chemotaxis protein CheZ